MLGSCWNTRSWDTGSTVTGYAASRVLHTYTRRSTRLAHSGYPPMRDYRSRRYYSARRGYTCTRSYRVSRRLHRCRCQYRYQCRYRYLFRGLFHLNSFFLLFVFLILVSLILCFVLHAPRMGEASPPRLAFPEGSVTMRVAVIRTIPKRSAPMATSTTTFGNQTLTANSYYGSRR